MSHAMQAMGAFLFALLAGCATLTPQQSAALKEAQLFVDKVTDAYAVGRVKVVVGDESGYDANAHWIHIAPRFLAGTTKPSSLPSFSARPHSGFA